MKTLYGIRLDDISNLTDFYHENGYIFISDYLDKSGLLAFESEFVDCCEVAGIKGNGFSEICKDLDANDKEKLYDFLREMEFNRLLSKVISDYGEFSKDKNTSAKNSTKFDLKKYKTILKIHDLEKWIKKIEEKEKQLHSNIRTKH